MTKQLFVAHLLLAGLLAAGHAFGAAEKRPAGAATVSPEARLAETKTLRVDVAALAKNQRPLVLGVNKGPEAGTGINITRALGDLGVTEIRTHDFCGPCDWYTIFPDWNADPERESSYHFQASDEKIARIMSGGFAPYFRLGISWNTLPNNTNKWRSPPGVPRFDPAKWASICRHIVMHYNDGWANGFHYAIRYWEIWNEPDLSRFWKGTAGEYYALYEQTARALKAHDPRLKVGGCGLANLGSQPYYGEFITFCATRNVPLDFYSWHLYAQTPKNYIAAASRCRNTLDRNGFKDAESHCTEWNVLCGKPDDPKHGNLIGATHAAGVLIHLRDNSVSRAYFYPLTDGWGLFQPDGAWRKRGYAFQAFHRLQRDTPRQLTVEGREDTNYAVAAARNAAGDLVQVLVSDMDSRYRGFSLTLDNLPPVAACAVEYLAVDETHNLERVATENATTTAAGRLVLQRGLASPAVLLVRITPASRPKMAIPKGPLKP